MTDDEASQLRQLVRDGYCNADISRAMNRSGDWVRKQCTRLGITPARKRCKIDKEYLYARWRDGASGTQIAKELGVAPKSAYEALREMGHEWRGREKTADKAVTHIKAPDPEPKPAPTSAMLPPWATVEVQAAVIAHGRTYTGRAALAKLYGKTLRQIDLLHHALRGDAA